MAEPAHTTPVERISNIAMDLRALCTVAQTMFEEATDLMCMFSPAAKPAAQSFVEAFYYSLGEMTSLADELNGHANTLEEQRMATKRGEAETLQ